jgi:hypothetical protein
MVVGAVLVFLQSPGIQAVSGVPALPRGSTATVPRASPSLQIGIRYLKADDEHNDPISTIPY